MIRTERHNTHLKCDVCDWELNELQQELTGLRALRQRIEALRDSEAAKVTTARGADHTRAVILTGVLTALLATEGGGS